MRTDVEIKKRHPIAHHFNMAQGYSHILLYVTALLMLWFAYDSTKWASGSKKPAAAYVVFSLLLIAGSTVSVVMHQDINDGVSDDHGLGVAEYAVVGGMFAAAVIAFVGMWFVQGLRTPFKTDRLFLPIMAAIITCVGVMTGMFFRGRGYYTGHKKKIAGRNEDGVSNRRINDGWTDDYVIYNLYHLQWHISASTFGFLLLLAFHILARGVFDVTSI